jgi:hypothetical protein
LKKNKEKEKVRTGFCPGALLRIFSFCKVFSSKHVAPESMQNWLWLVGQLVLQNLCSHCHGSFLCHDQDGKALHPLIVYYLPPTPIY